MRSSTRCVIAGSSNDCPAATRRTASTRSVPRICLSTYPDAPAMIAANSASSSSYEVRISPLIDESMARTSRHTSMPLPSGSLGRRPGLADHLDITRGVQQVGQAAPDHLVVVEQEHTDHVPFLPCARP